MKISHAASVLGLVSVTGAVDCTTEAITPLLPAGARLASVTQVANNATFQVPASDIAYPTSPTNLQALCAIQVNVTSSNSSAFSFGLFLPQNWNERFLAVGNGGFAGGENQPLSIEYSMHKLTLFQASIGSTWEQVLDMALLPCLPTPVTTVPLATSPGL